MLQEVTVFGLTIRMYPVFNILSMVILFLFFILQEKHLVRFCPLAQKQNTPKKQYAAAFGVTAAIYFFGMFLLYFLNLGFGAWFTNGNANYYGSLTAWLLAFIILPTVFGISPLSAADMYARGLPLSLFVAKFACFFHGCCHSFEVSSGFYYNQSTQRFEFPVQLVEAFAALALYLVLRLIKKFPPGCVFPAYIFLYSVLRFGSEFLRDDLPRLLGVLNAYHILSVIFAILGLNLYLVIREYGAAIQKRFDQKLIS